MTVLAIARSVRPLLVVGAVAMITLLATIMMIVASSQHRRFYNFPTNQPLTYLLTCTLACISVIPIIILRSVSPAGSQANSEI